MPFNEPEVSGRLNPRDCIGHLLMVWPVEYIEHSPTKYTKAGQASDVIVVDVVDLDDIDEDSGLPGKLFRNVWWRPGRLIGDLRKKIGTQDPFLAWMTQGGASPGMNAPFKLASATADAKSVALAEAWLTVHPDFKPTTPVSESVLNQSRRPEPAAPSEPESTEMPQREETALERLARISQQGAARLQSPPGDIPF